MNNKKKEKRLKYILPTNVLAIGPVIMFFSMSRMIVFPVCVLLAIKKIICTKRNITRIPFKNVYFTGIIKDKLG